MLTKIKGDITKVESNYICQQCNCIAVRPHGLSKTIADVLKVCPYSRRRGIYNQNIAVKSDRPPVGSILTEKSPIKDVSVICMFAQFCYGKPEVYNVVNENIDDSYTKREIYFQKCLNRINKKIKKDAVIAFPKYIGCGLANGNWKVYRKMIKKFSEERNVIIVEWNK
jgi:hypothetical protein